MSSLPLISLSTLLKRYRRRAGLTQEALAECARLSTQAISTLERGTRRAPRQETLELLADALRLTPAERAQLQQVARGQVAPAVSVSVPHLPIARELLPLAGRSPEVARLE